MWKPLDSSLKYTIHRQVLGDDPSNIDNRLNLWDYIVSVARTEEFIQSAENGVRVETNKLKLGGFLTEDTVINGHTRQYNLSLLSLKDFSVQANQFNILSPLTVVTSGTNGTSGIKFTNINSSTTPVTGQPLGVDANGNIVVVNFSSPTCDDVNFLVNSVTYKALTCGVDFDLNVVDADDNPVGTIELPDVLRIANSEVNIAGVYTEQLLSESNLTLNVTRDSASYTPTYDDTTKTINVDCPIISDSIIQFNGSNVDTLAPEDTFNLIIEQGGSTFTDWTYDDTTNTLNITSTTPSGYCGLPLDIPAQIGTVVNTADVASAFAAGAFATPFPTGYAGYNSLDLTDPTGSTLVQNNVLFGTKNRFTNLTGSPNTYTTVDWVDGTGTTRTAGCMIDHLYGNKGVYLLLTDNTGRWGVEWPTRLDGATYNSLPIYPVSRGILESLMRYDISSLNHLEAYMAHSGLVYSGEVPVSSDTSVYSMTGITLGSTARNSFLKVLLFQQIP